MSSIDMNDWKGPDGCNWDVSIGRTRQAWEQVLIFLHEKYGGEPVLASQITKDLFEFSKSNHLPSKVWKALYSTRDKRSPTMRIGKCLDEIRDTWFDSRGLRVEVAPRTYETAPNWWVIRDNTTYDKTSED